MEAERFKRVVRAAHEPPENELPVVLVPGISWSGAGVFFVIPALHLYSTGFELLILYRSQWPQAATGDDLSAADRASASLLHVREIGEKLNGLKVNGRPVEQLGEQFHDHGFDGRAWVPASALVDSDQIVTLDWPGIENAEHRIARSALVDALPKVTALW